MLLDLYPFKMNNRMDRTLILFSRIFEKGTLHNHITTLREGKEGLEFEQELSYPMHNGEFFQYAYWAEFGEKELIIAVTNESNRRILFEIVDKYDLKIISSSELNEASESDGQVLFYSENGDAWQINESGYIQKGRTKYLLDPISFYK